MADTNPHNSSALNSESLPWSFLSHEVELKQHPNLFFFLNPGSFHAHRTKPEPTEDSKQVLEPQIQNSADSEQVPPSKMNGVSSPESTPTNQEEPRCDQGERPVTEAGGDDEAAPSQRAVSNHNPQQRINPAPASTNNQSSRNNPTPSRAHSGQQRHPEGGPPHDPKNQQENVVLRRVFLTRAIPEREAQRKSSMAQLQQWVNQRRSGTSQDDVSRYKSN